ncbi:hypothetical protein BC943DRAFT_270814 [Umbelopsis sp. AD052]|nr:hypothetical protein BC943DRAFT_270814 [Umbelopsis sp. AD052]
MYASKGTANIINTVARQGLLSKQLTAASRPTTLLPSPNRSAGKLYATGRASLSANRQQQQQQDSTAPQGTSLNPIQAWTGNNSAAIFQKYAGVRYNHSAAANSAQQDGAVSSGSSHPDATKQGNARILQAKRSRDLRKVESEFTRMKESGVQLSAQTYTLVLDSYATLRKPGHPPRRLLAVYQEMIEGGFKPSAYTYMILIHALCKRDIEVQKTLLMLNKQNDRSGQSPSNLESLQSENNIQKALAIFEASVTDNLYQDFDTEVFNSLLRSLSQYGNTQDGIYVFEHLEKARSAEPNGRTFAALITLYGKAGDIQGALECFNEYKTVRGSMEKHNPAFVYSALVDAYIKCGDPAAARKIIEEDSVNDKVETSVKTWNTLMREYCDQKNLDGAYDVLAKLQNDPALPDPVASTYGPLLTALSELKMTDKAHEIYQKMSETDISKSYNNLATYAHLLLENKDLDRLQDVMFDMSKKGLDPEDSLTQKFVMQLASKDINRAIEALRQLYADVSSRSFVKVTDGINQTAMYLAAQPNNSVSNILDILKIVHPFGVRASVPVSEYLCNVFSQTRKNPAAWSKLKETFGVTEHFLTIEALFNSHNLSREDFRDLALDMAKAMVEVNIQPNSGLYARVGARLAKSQDEEGEKQWQAFFEPYLKDEAPKLDAYKADDHMMHRTTKGDLLTGEAMKAAVQGKKDECLNILKKQIVDQNMVPTIEAVREMIHIFGRDHGVASARNLYEVVGDSFDKLPDTIIRKKAHAAALASLLNVHLQAKDFDAGQSYYKQLRDLDQYPDGNGYALLINAIPDGDNVAQETMRLYNELLFSNVKPTVFLYNVLISKLGKARSLKQVIQAHTDMKKMMLTPTAVTYNALISAFTRCGAEKTAVDTFNEMERHPKFKPSPATYNNMIQFYVRHESNREKALEFFERSRTSNSKPTAYTYRLLMEAYANVVPYDMPTAHKMLTDMKKENLQPEPRHYATLIHSYGILQRDVQSAERVFEQLKKDHIQPDESVYRALHDTYVANNEMDKAEKTKHHLNGDKHNQSSSAKQY